MANSRLYYDNLIDDALDIIRDTTSGHITTNMRFRASNRVLDRIASAFDGEYASVRKVIQYLNGETDYHMENNLGITDFKNPKDLRLQSNHNELAEYMYPAEFATREGSRSTVFSYAIDINKTDKILRIIHSADGDSIVMGQANDTTEGGATWVGTDDAASVAQDTTISKVYGSSVKFNIDVSGSANDFATLTLSSLTTALDLSDYEDIGKIRLWVYLPTATSIDSFTLRWGQDSSNYWEVAAVTTNALGQSFETGWNRIEFDWADATETGTPAAGTIDWMQVVTNHSLSADLNGVRINQLIAFLPIDMDLLYYTSFLAKDSSGDMIDDLTETSTDEIILPVNFRETVISGISWQFFGLLKGWVDNETLKWETDFKNELNKLKGAYGHTNKRPIPRMKLR